MVDPFYVTAIQACALPSRVEVRDPVSSLHIVMIASGRYFLKQQNQFYCIRKVHPFTLEKKRGQSLAA